MKISKGTMGKKKQPNTTADPTGIFEATLGINGSVIRGQPLTQAQAEARRQAGQDVLVCGLDLSTNRRLAGNDRNECEWNRQALSSACECRSACPAPLST